MVAQIIEVDAIQHPGPASGGGDGCQQAMQLPFTGIATVLWVAGVSRIGQLGGGLFQVPDPEPERLGAGFLQQMGGQRRRYARNRQGAIAEDFGGKGRH